MYGGQLRWGDPNASPGSGEHIHETDDAVVVPTADNKAHNWASETSPVCLSRNSAFVQSSLSPFMTTVLPFLRLLVCATSEDVACGWTPCQGLPQSSSWPPSTSCVGLKLQAKSAHLVFCIPHLAGVGTWPNSSRGTRNGFNGQIPTACQAGLCSMGSEA